jgi:hypothetical protein
MTFFQASYIIYFIMSTFVFSMQFLKCLPKRKEAITKKLIKCNRMVILYILQEHSVRKVTHFSISFVYRGSKFLLAAHLEKGRIQLENFGG